MSAPAAARVALWNLGCRVNRVEIDLIASTLERAGCRVVEPKEADLVIVNTCAVTGEAQTKTRKSVRQALRLPQAPVVIATGCAASLFAGELMEAAPGVIIEPNKSLVAQRALDELGMGFVTPMNDVLAVSPTPTGRMRPGIKIQDGCDNRCSFCIVWKARGPSRSLPPERVLAAVREACDRQAHEVVLTGINLGTYHADAEDGLGPQTDLAGLLDVLLEQTPIERIRLSSIEPPDVSERLLDVMAGSEGRLAPFLHICLQSGCDETLRRMRRIYDTALFRDVVEMARTKLDRLVLGTDLIVGFPGETDAEFEASLDFCRQMQFAKMHIFRYSKRPGTPAAQATHQVDPQVSAARSARMRELARQMRAARMRQCVGTEDLVLVQAPGRAVSEGLFDVAVDPRLPVGKMARVRIDGMEGDLLVANAVD